MPKDNITQMQYKSPKNTSGLKWSWYKYSIQVLKNIGHLKLDVGKDNAFHIIDTWFGAIYV
jgi:hypothetical protein